MKKVLITGAAGFIGSHLVDHLLKSGESVSSLRLLISENDSLENLPKKKIDILRGDVRDKALVKKAMEDIEVVYHLAARTIEPRKFSDTEYYQVNVAGTQNLLDECRGKNLQKFIFFSSIAVYGLPAWVGNIENWNETAKKNPTEVYGQSKLEAEKRVTKAYEKWGIPYAIIRPTSVYGPRDKRNLLELYQVMKKHMFFLIGEGGNKMDYVYVGDIVRAARLAQLSRLKSGDYIIGNGKPISLKFAVECVARSIGETIPKWHMPKNLALGLSYMTQFAGNLLGIRSPLFPTRVKVMTTNCYYDISKATKELGYKPRVTFQTGTRITGKWLIEKGIL